MNSLEGVEKLYVYASNGQVDEFVRVTTSEEHWWISMCISGHFTDEEVLKKVNKLLNLGYTIKTK